MSESIPTFENQEEKQLEFENEEIQTTQTINSGYIPICAYKKGTITSKPEPSTLTKPVIGRMDYLYLQAEFNEKKEPLFGLKPCKVSAVCYEKNSGKGGYEIVLNVQSPIQKILLD